MMLAFSLDGNLLAVGFYMDRWREASRFAGVPALAFRDASVDLVEALEMCFDGAIVMGW